MSIKLTSAFIILISAGTLSLQSCQKSELPGNTGAGNASLTDLAMSKSAGGGGASGGGHNGGTSSGGGSNTPAPTGSALAPADTNSSPLPITEIITLGKWKLTSFVQNNDNTTADFSNYVFTFNTDGTMIADNSGSQTTGSWRYQEAVFYYGLPVYGSTPYGFNMFIGSGLPLISLNENYFISRKTLTTINIDSVNPSENEHITFSKLAQ